MSDQVYTSFDQPPASDERDLTLPWAQVNDAMLARLRAKGIAFQLSKPGLTVRVQDDIADETVFAFLRGELQ